MERIATATTPRSPRPGWPCSSGGPAGSRRWLSSNPAGQPTPSGPVEPRPRRWSGPSWRSARDPPPCSPPRRSTAVNVADLLRETAAATPGKPALVFRSRPIAYADLDERVDLTAAALVGFGVDRGDRVALLAGNVPEFVYGLYGALRLGAIACPLNVMLTPEELEHILTDCGAKMAIVDLGALAGLLSIRPQLPDLQTVIVIGGPPAPAGTVSLEEALRGDAEPLSVTTEPSDLAVIAYTAGTTDAPKGAMLSHASLLANLDQMARVEALAPAPDDVLLLALPMFHIYALNAILGLTIKNGATAVLVERFDPLETLDLIERQGVTVVVGAPPMFAAWVQAVDQARGAEK